MSSSEVADPQKSSSSFEGSDPMERKHVDYDDSDIPEPPNESRAAYVGVCLACGMVAFGGFIFGWDTGTISGFVAQSDFIRRFGMINDEGHRYLSKVRTGLMVSIFNIGCAIGGIILSKIGDVKGRRPALGIVAFIYIIGIVIQIASIDKWYQYFIGRIISGLGVGGISVLSPTLISEVAPSQLRGSLVSTYQLMVTLGIFLGYCTNFGTKNYDDSTQWRVPLGLSFAWALFLIGGMAYVPESPRHLVEVGQHEKAKKALAFIHKCPIDHPYIEYEINELEGYAAKARAAGEAGWGELITGKPAMFRRAMSGIMIQSLQQLTGDNYFFYYGTVVFKSVGLEDGFEAAIIFGVVNFVSTIFSLFTVDRFGRRNCLMYGAVGMVCCYVVYASVGVTRLWPNGPNGGVSSQGAGNCMICFACFYLFCFATTWAPIAYVIISETFPLRVKAKAMSISTAANWIWGFLISFFTPFISNSIHFAYGYVFMGCMVFAWFYVFFFVNETKGLTLEEVDEMYGDGVLPWKSPKWIPASRRDDTYDVDAMAHDDVPWYKRVIGRG